MTRRRRYLLWGGEVLALLTVLAMLLPLEARGANGFASPAFETQWRSVEGAVPNFWGPVATAREGQREEYAEGNYNGEPGQRLVQYFDKARMEQTASGGTVTNGLLTVELKTGQLQLGNSTFRPYAGASIGLAGDAGSPGPTYTSLSQLPENDPQQSGSVSRRYDAATNTFTTGTPMTDPNMAFASYLKEPSGKYGQNIPKAFADFLAKIPGGPVPAMGYAISPAFQANVRVNGVDSVPVVIQAFERKVLTYTASNAPAFQVEFGNIGQHYYQWRYVTLVGGGTATTNPLGVGGAAPFVTPDATGYALTSTASAACASPTAVGVVSSNATTTAVSYVPVCSASASQYDATSTAYAQTATVDAKFYNATSTAIYKEYYATSTAITIENNNYNATSTAIYKQYYADGTSTTVAYNATSTALAGTPGSSAMNSNGTNTTDPTAIVATAYAGLTATADAKVYPTSVYQTVVAGLTATANGGKNATAQGVINATGTAAATQGTINNNPGGRPQASVIPTTATATALAQTAAAQMATANAAGTQAAMAQAAAATSSAMQTAAAQTAATQTTTAQTASAQVGVASANSPATQTASAFVNTAVAKTQAAASPPTPNATSVAGTVIAAYDAASTALVPATAPVGRPVQVAQSTPMSPARSASQLIPTPTPPKR